MDTHHVQSNLKIYLLGTPELYLDDKPLTGLSLKSQALLFYLAMMRQAHSRVALATLLWGDSPEKNARASVRKALQQLNQTLADHLILVDQTVALASDTRVWVDAMLFTDQLTQAETHNNIALLEAAIQQYRGDFLSGFLVRNTPDFERWQATQQIRLREQLLGALQTLNRHWTTQNNLPNAIAITRQIIELEPWREEAHRQLMGLLARNGERGAALAHFEVCRETLQRELDVEPAAETIALYEQIRANAFTVNPADPPPNHPRCPTAAQSAHANNPITWPRRGNYPAAATLCGSKSTAGEYCGTGGHGEEPSGNRSRAKIPAALCRWHPFCGPGITQQCRDDRAYDCRRRRLHLPK